MRRVPLKKVGNTNVIWKTPIIIEMMSTKKTVHVLDR